MRLLEWFGALGVGGVALCVIGCGMSNPRQGYIKSPEAVQCATADCPTLELPAPNSDEAFNPVQVVRMDNAAISPPMVFANRGRIWWVMRINPGKHSFTPMTDTGSTNLIGAIGSSNQELAIDAQPGKRYWLFSRPGAGGYSAKFWIEEADGDRKVLAGERNLEGHSMAADIFLAEGEAKAKQSKVEIWWAGAPETWKMFFANSPKEGQVPADLMPKAAPAAAAK